MSSSICLCSIELQRGGRDCGPVETTADDLRTLPHTTGRRTQTVARLSGCFERTGVPEAQL
eukprot:16380273-Heterocapsa_arctica.AAC.1